jgi:hypothetical protein
LISIVDIEELVRKAASRIKISAGIKDVLAPDGSYRVFLSL